MPLLIKPKIRLGKVHWDPSGAYNPNIYLAVINWFLPGKDYLITPHYQKINPNKEIKTLPNTNSDKLHISNTPLANAPKILAILYLTKSLSQIIFIYQAFRSNHRLLSNQNKYKNKTNNHIINIIFS